MYFCEVTNPFRTNAVRKKCATIRKPPLPTRAESKVKQSIQAQNDHKEIFQAPQRSVGIDLSYRGPRIKNNPFGKMYLPLTVTYHAVF